MDSPKISVSPKQEQTCDSCPPACPVCGGRLNRAAWQADLLAVPYHLRACCEGGRG